MKKTIITLYIITLSPLIGMDIDPEKKLVSIIKNTKKNKNSLDRAKELMNKPSFNPNYKYLDENGKHISLTRWAFIHKRLDIARLLIDTGANTNPRNEPPLLVYACDGCNSIYSTMHTGGNNAALEMDEAIKLCRILIAKKGASKTINTKHGLSLYRKDVFLLHEAAKYSNYELCKLLLDHGADVNLFDCNLNTASKYACSNIWKEGLKLFLNYGASLEFRDQSRYTLLMNVANQTKANDMVEVIIRHIINSRKAAKTFMLCLYRMHKERPDPCLQLLLRHRTSLLQHHVLKACAECNKTMLLAQLTARDRGGNNAFSLKYPTKMHTVFAPKEEDKDLNPANIDRTIRKFLHKDLGGTQE